MPRTNLLFACACVALSGCTVGPHYKEPASPLLAKFDAQVQQTPPEPPPQAWWTVFHDPELESLITRAVANNRDLKRALSRIRESRAERAVVAGALIPEVDATAGYNRALGSKTVVLPLGGSSSGGGSSGGSSASSAASSQANTGVRAEDEPAPPSPPSGGNSASSAQPGGPQSPLGEGGLPGVTSNLFQAGFDAVWEIDLFGSTRRSIEAADAQAAAAVEGERGVRISLMAEVAMSYLQLRADQTREGILRRSVAADERQLKLETDTYEAGLGDDSEAAQAAEQVSQTRAQLPPLLAEERVERHSLAFLLAQDPGSLDSELAAAKPLPELPPEIPVGLPSDLLRRRPDIRQAEDQLRAAYAEIGVATADLFPQFSITGALGLDSSTFRQLPDWKSRYYSIAPGIRWPILDWNRLQAGIKVENELEAQSLLTYQTAVAQALKDVEDALVRYEAEKDHLLALTQAVAEAKRAQQIASDTFDKGLANELAAINAEKATLQTEDALAQSEASLRTDVVGLYKALGGGWNAKP